MNISIKLLDDSDGLNIAGRQRIQIDAQPPPNSFDLYVDDKKIASLISGAGTVSYGLDTTQFSDGSHVIRAEAVYKTRRSKTQVAVSVKNNLPAGSYGAGAYGAGAYGGSQ